MRHKDTTPFIRKLSPPPLLSQALKPVTLLGRLSLLSGKVQTTHCFRASQWVPRYKLFYVVKKSIGFLNFFLEAMNIARQVTTGNSEIVAFHDPSDTRVAPVVRFGIHACSGHLTGVQVCTTAPAPCRQCGHPTSCLFT